MNPKPPFLVAFVVATFIFLAGVLVGYLLP